MYVSVIDLLFVGSQPTNGEGCEDELFVLYMYSVVGSTITLNRPAGTYVL